MIERMIDRAAERHLLACMLVLAVALAAMLPGFAGLMPMDRDEPRFAQASKQMLESGDVVDIRFQGEARNKKPVGIYWMQAAAVALGDRLGVPDARTTIWLYRLPSLFGGLATALLTYWAALPLTTRRGALLSGCLIGSSLILVVEAHLAKTDAVLATTVVLAMGVLARAWMRRREGERLDIALCALFWTAIGVGILVKGPITPMVPLFAAVVLCVRERSARWLLALRPGLGVIWCLLIVLPWFLLIVKTTGTAFFSEAVGHDMLGKVAGAQESHGAPPGSYLAAFWVTGWPMAPFVMLAAPSAWRDRWTDAVFFLLAWVVPLWLLFEAVPTKLPHYVLPVYPALAILAARGAERFSQMPPVRGLRLGLFAVLLLLLPLALPVALVAAQGRFASVLDALTLAAAALATTVALGAAALAIRAVRQNAIRVAGVASIVAAVAVYAFVLGWFMNARRADLIALSPRLAQAAKTALSAACPAPAYATAGDNEPSLVFLTDTNLLMTDGAGAARFLNAGPCRVAFVNRPEEPAFAAALAPAAKVAVASRVAGLNINGGKKLDIGVYVRQDAAP